MDTGQWLTVGGLALAGLGLFSGVWQYARGQRWKRQEYVVQQVEAFQADPRIRTAHKLLDWTSLESEELPVPPKDAPGYMGWPHLQNALVPHIYRGVPFKGAFNDLEYWLRDLFDHLFDRLERFAHDVETGLVKKEDLRPYMRYLLDLIADADAKDIRRQLRHNMAAYIREYFRTLPKFFERMGRPLSPDQRPVLVADPDEALLETDSLGEEIVVPLPARVPTAR